MNRLHKILLTASIHLSNIYSFHNLITKLVLSQLNKSYRNIVGFLLSIIISIIIIRLVDFMLKNNKLSSFGYSLVRFFVATYVSVTFVFLTAFALTFQVSSEFIPFLIYPFLLYVGFFFNLTFSRFAFASKKEYLENNPQISTGMIIITRMITFSIFVLSFLPITFIGIEYVLVLFSW